MPLTSTETTFKVERGANDRDGQFVVIKVQRGMYRKPVPPSWGDVAWVSRDLLSWWPDEAAANAAAAAAKAAADAAAKAAAEAVPA